MSLPFDRIILKEHAIRKKMNTYGKMDLYDRKKTDTNHNSSSHEGLLLLSMKLDEYDKHIVSSQESYAQIAAAIEKLKDKNDNMNQILEQVQSGVYNKEGADLDHISTGMAELKNMINELNHTFLNQLSDTMNETQKQSLFSHKKEHLELFDEIAKVKKSLKRGRIFQGFIFLFNLLSLGALVIFAAYEMGFIRF